FSLGDYLGRMEPVAGEALPPTQSTIADSTTGETPDAQSIAVGAPNETSGNNEKAVTEIHTIDVGQGDAALIRQGEHWCLIDAGTKESAQSLVDYLNAVGVRKLDCVIMTHAHADHIGGMPAVLRAFEVERFVLPNFALSETPTTKIFQQTLLALKTQKNCKVETATSGAEIVLGEGTLTVIGAGIKTDGQNNTSICTRFVAPGVTYLNTGDAEQEAERALLASGVPLKADIFKAGHHGSDTSNTAAFLTALAPRYVAISCGAGNDYGHPHKEVLERLATVGAEVLRTDLAGSIIFSVPQSGIALTPMPSPAT
ncbi:MAG: ComEC/Rec2 family competence protein, partial [Pygmaiobacter sp.]